MRKTAIPALGIILLLVFSACSTGGTSAPEKTASSIITPVSEATAEPAVTAPAGSSMSPDKEPAETPAMPKQPVIHKEEAPDEFTGVWKAVSGPEVLEIEKDGTARMDDTEAWVLIAEPGYLGLAFLDPDDADGIADLGSVKIRNGYLTLTPSDPVTDRFPATVFYREGQENPAGSFLGSWIALNGKRLEIGEEGSSYDGKHLEITSLRDDGGIEVRIGRDGFARSYLHFQEQFLVSTTFTSDGSELMFCSEADHPLKHYMGTWTALDGSGKVLKLDLDGTYAYDGVPLELSVSWHDDEIRLAMKPEGTKAFFGVEEFDGCLGWRGAATDPERWFAREGEAGPASRLTGVWTNTDPQREAWGDLAPEEVSFSSDGTLTVNGETYALVFEGNAGKWKYSAAGNRQIYGYYSPDKPDETQLYVSNITCPMKRKG